MTTRTMSRETLATCPACDKPLVFDIEYDVTLGPVQDAGERTATLIPVGARIAHDCMPKVTRDGAL